ncbi:MAG: DUF86 domain-containing protein [Candidatus Aenigmarchaeota archaeon]|nr:DUF86 domain-containing protein [Candidatus Aenigmarchaeota archaeon]
MDKEKVLLKLAEMEGYLKELKGIIPKSVGEYRNEKKRACERLLQISLESVFDVCNVLVSGLELGVPYSEDDMFKKLKAAGMISEELYKKLRKMKACRNILVHRYGLVDDRKIFSILKNNVSDFDLFKKEIVRHLNKA